MTNKNPSFKYEKHYWEKGFNNVLGMDEVGRGAFAGPLVAAAVILPKEFDAKDIKDSKLLSVKKREELNEYIINNALYYSINEVSVRYINKYGIGLATHRAFLNCLKKLEGKYDFVLVDGFKIKTFNELIQQPIVHGDRLSVSIASASIIAKVYRDNLMTTLHYQYPEYNFSKNKGYGTKYHRKIIKKCGLSPLHRTSFKLNIYT